MLVNGWLHYGMLCCCWSQLTHTRRKMISAWRRSAWVTSDVQSGGSSVAKALEIQKYILPIIRGEGADAVAEGKRIGLGGRQVHDNRVTGGAGE